jgi:hypothetical protein
MFPKDVLKRELTILKSHSTPTRTLPSDLKVQLYVQLKDIELVNLLEERYSYGLDLELDMKRVLGEPTGWKLQFEEVSPPNERKSPPELLHTDDSILNPVVVTALAGNSKMAPDVATIVSKYLPFAIRR